MRIAIIGRSELLYNTTELLLQEGFKIPIIITSKAAPEYKKNELDFKKLANKINATFIQTGRINNTKVINSIKSLPKIDIAVSINYSGIIETEIINFFPLGILNAHAGDLPKYRGNACIAWAIINGENKIGLCIHKMIGGELDSGDIVTKKYFPININTKVGDGFKWIEKETPKLILDSINKLLKNPNNLEKQSKNPKDILRGYPRIPKDGKINWNMDNETVVRLINASSEPFVGAYSTYNEKKVIIWRAKLFEDDENYLAVPGQIAKINKNTGNIIVITGNGKIEIEEIEINNKRGKPVDFIKSIRIRFE